MHIWKRELQLYTIHASNLTGEEWVKAASFLLDFDGDISIYSHLEITYFLAGYPNLAMLKGWNIRANPLGTVCSWGEVRVRILWFWS